MTENWDEARLQRYIDDEVPESLKLEYKRGIVLSKDAKKNPKWMEAFTKDVSAIANSAGGILIYGIAEEDDVPTEFSPVDKTEFSRERLDQVISSNIQPRIDGLIIYPIQLSSHENHVAYVVKIPQSDTAHQASDNRYHKRLNTTITAMAHYEIVDVMGRSKHPNIELEFLLSKEARIYIEGLFPNESRPEPRHRLHIKISNIGRKTAHHYVLNVYVPSSCFKATPAGTNIQTIDGTQFIRWQTTNYIKDHWEPLLPSLNKEWIILMNNFNNEHHQHDNIIWECYADEAVPKISKQTFGLMKRKE